MTFTLPRFPSGLTYRANQLRPFYSCRSRLFRLALIILFMLNPRTFTFGGTSAIVTSMGLVIGLQSATASETTIISGLLIVAVADNISDSLSIHMYQEAEKLEPHAALKTTLMNFLARFLIALSFVVIVMAFSTPYAAMVAMGWGFVLLAGLSYLLARVRGASPLNEVGKHIGIAILVIATSRLIGAWILHHVASSNAPR